MPNGNAAQTTNGESKRCNCYLVECCCDKRHRGIKIRTRHRSSSSSGSDSSNAIVSQLDSKITVKVPNCPETCAFQRRDVVRVKPRRAPNDPEHNEVPTVLAFADEHQDTKDMERIHEQVSRLVAKTDKLQHELDMERVLTEKLENNLKIMIEQCGKLEDDLKDRDSKLEQLREDYLTLQHEVTRGPRQVARDASSNQWSQHHSRSQFAPVEVSRSHPQNENETTGGAENGHSKSYSRVQMIRDDLLKMLDTELAELPSAVDKTRQATRKESTGKINTRKECSKEFSRSNQTAKAPDNSNYSGFQIFSMPSGLKKRHSLDEQRKTKHSYHDLKLQNKTFPAGREKSRVVESLGMQKNRVISTPHADKTTPKLANSLSGIEHSALQGRSRGLAPEQDASPVSKIKQTIREHFPEQDKDVEEILRGEKSGKILIETDRSFKRKVVRLADSPRTPRHAGK